MASFRSWLRVFLLDKRPSRFVKHLRRARKWRAKHPGTPCHTCGYDIGKDQSLAICPECGNTINWNPTWLEDGYRGKWGILLASLGFLGLMTIMNVVVVLPTLLLTDYSGDAAVGFAYELIAGSLFVIYCYRQRTNRYFIKYFAPIAHTRKYKNVYRRVRRSIRYLSYITALLLILLISILFIESMHVLGM